MNSYEFVTSPGVAAALKAGKPVVALESTIISHGLPRPSNLEVAREVEDIVRQHGATPATIAILDGKVCIGLTDDQLVAIANRDDIAKAVGLDGVLAHGMLTMGAAVQVAVDWIGDPGRVIDYSVRFTKPVFVDARNGAVLTVSGKIGEIDAENSIVRIDITAVAADLAVLGKAQARVHI